MNDQQIEQQIRDAFRENYERLRLEGAPALTDFALENALTQILFYWRKLRTIATNVTDTEVKLSLPEQNTPKGRKFTIEGIVDIVREDNETWMYDIKTHDPDYIRGNIQFYADQLNIYAHIWQELRKNQLDHTAVIATQLPKELVNTDPTENIDLFNRFFQQWEPVIHIPFDQQGVNQTIQDFACVVDQIEDNEFQPPPLEKLNETIEGTNTTFATRICRNCDARFSCETYRQYALADGGRTTAHFRQYIDDYGDDAEQQDWISANLNNLNIQEQD